MTASLALLHVLLSVLFILSQAMQELERLPRPSGRQPVPVPELEPAHSKSETTRPIGSGPTTWSEIAARDLLLSEGRLLLQQGLLQEAEERFSRALESTSETGERAEIALGIVECMRRTGRLLELDRRIEELRREWLAAGSPHASSAHLTLVPVRAFDRWLARGELELLWNVLARVSISQEELSPIGSDFVPGDEQRMFEALYACDPFRTGTLRQIALQALLQNPDTARRMALEQIVERPTAAIVVLASLHDERVQPRIREALESYPDLQFNFVHGWWCMLLAIEGSWSSYAYLEGEALGSSWRSKAARVVLEAFPRSYGPRTFTFQAWWDLQDRLEQAGFFPPRCGQPF